MSRSNTSIGIILRYLRRDRKLMQKEVCTVLNVTEQAYSNYETGKRLPDPSSVCKLASFYQIEPALMLSVLYTDISSIQPEKTAWSEQSDSLHALSDKDFILLDQCRKLSFDDQYELLQYTMIKARCCPDDQKDCPNKEAHLISPLPPVPFP